MATFFQVATDFKIATERIGHTANERDWLSQIFRSPCPKDYPGKEWEPADTHGPWRYTIPAPGFVRSPSYEIRNSWPLALHGRIIKQEIGGGSFQHYAMLSLRKDIQFIPPHPGIRPSELDEFVHPDYIFNDGSLGPFDLTRYPQEYDHRRPWGGFHRPPRMIRDPYRKLESHNPTEFFRWDGYQEDKGQGGRWDIPKLDKLLQRRQSVEAWLKHVLAVTNDPDGIRLAAEFGPALPYFDALTRTDIQGWCCWAQGRDAVGRTCRYISELYAIGFWLEEVRRQASETTQARPTIDALGVWVGSIASDEAWEFLSRSPLPLYALFPLTPDNPLTSEAKPGSLHGDEYFRTNAFLARFTGIPSAYEPNFYSGCNRPSWSERPPQPRRFPGSLPNDLKVLVPGGRILIPCALRWDLPFLSYPFLDLWIKRSPGNGSTPQEMVVRRRIQKIHKCSAHPIRPSSVVAGSQMPVHPMALHIPRRPSSLGNQKRIFIERDELGYRWPVPVGRASFKSVTNTYRHLHDLGNGDWLASAYPWPKIANVHPPAPPRAGNPYEAVENNPFDDDENDGDEQIASGQIRYVSQAPSDKDFEEGPKQQNRAPLPPPQPPVIDGQMHSLPLASKDVAMEPVYSIRAYIAACGLKVTATAASGASASSPAAAASGGSASPSAAAALGTSISPPATGSTRPTRRHPLDNDASASRPRSSRSRSPPRRGQGSTGPAIPRSPRQLPTHPRDSGHDNSSDDRPVAQLPIVDCEMLPSSTAIAEDVSSDCVMHETTNEAPVASPTGLILIPTCDASVDDATKLSTSISTIIPRVVRGRQHASDYLSYRLNCSMYPSPQPSPLNVQKAVFKSTPGSTFICYPLRIYNVDVDNQDFKVVVDIFLQMAWDNEWGEIIMISAQVEFDGTFSIDVGFRFMEDALIMWCRDGMEVDSHHWHITPQSGVVGKAYVAKTPSSDLPELVQRIKDLSSCAALEESLGDARHAARLEQIKESLAHFSSNPRVGSAASQEDMELWPDLMLDGNPVGAINDYKDKCKEKMHGTIFSEAVEWSIDPDGSLVDYQSQPYDGRLPHVAAVRTHHYHPKDTKAKTEMEGRAKGQSRRATRRYAQLRRDAWHSNTISLPAIPSKVAKQTWEEELLSIWDWYEECIGQIHAALNASGLATYSDDGSNTPENRRSLVLCSSFRAAEICFSRPARLRDVFGSAYTDLLALIAKRESGTVLSGSSSNGQYLHFIAMKLALMVYCYPNRSFLALVDLDPPAP